jgi:hypothetical protein
MHATGRVLRPSARTALLLLAALLASSASPRPADAAEPGSAAAPLDRSERFVLDESGVRLDVTVEAGPRRATRAGIERWLRTAARTVAGLLGRFPVPQVRVTVKPSGPRGEAVLFGQALRGREETLELFLCASATDDDLPGEWVAIHEMIHLVFPRIEREDAWINEGFVTYYQEVLRTRAGHQSEAEGWAKLADGFARGAPRGTDRTLEDESRAMGRTHAYWRVYWGGAAMALDLDLTIRRRTGGRRSLDDLVRFWWRRFGSRLSATRGRELLDAADAWLGQPLCRPLAETHLQRVAFADVDELFARIGIAVDGGRVTYLAAGPQIAERTRILRPGGR